MKTSALAAAALIAAGLLSATAHADPLVAPSIYGQYGHAGSRSGSDIYTLGATAPIAWQSSVWGSQVGAYWDVYGSFIRSDGFRNASDNHTWLIGLTPTLRMRFDEGRSPWFVDGGVGVSVTDVIYRFKEKAFSTRFNFGSHVAVGYSFGAQRAQEVSLRVQHFSNAGIKKPNPGDTFVQLRYAHAF